MTDIDQLSRRVADLEYRVKLLEKAREPKGVRTQRIKPWCYCGRDICRAPDCPSHTKPDPMGR